MRYDSLSRDPDSLDLRVPGIFLFARGVDLLKRADAEGEIVSEDGEIIRGSSWVHPDPDFPFRTRRDFHMMCLAYLDTCCRMLEICAESGDRGQVRYSPRYPSISGFCAFAGITPRDWSTIERNRAHFEPSFSWFVFSLEGAKLEGAAAGVYNTTVVVRDLGLVERVKQEAPDDSPKMLTPAALTQLTDEEKTQLRDLLVKAAGGEA